MRYRRLAAHIHSDFSDDCSWPLPKIISRLRWMGYHGALICEHDRTMTDAKWQMIMDVCERISTSGFVVVPGIEYQDPTHTIHLPVYGAAPFLGRSPDIPELLAHANEHGAVSVFAHPARRSAHDHFDPAWFRDLTAIEVWNRKYDGIRPNAWALQTAADHGLAQFTALDFHGPRQFFPLTLRIPAQDSASAADCVTAILEGRSTPRTIGLPPERLDAGRLAGLLDHLESSRAKVAPTIRRAERSLANAKGKR